MHLACPSARSALGGLYPTAGAYTLVTTPELRDQE